MLTPNEIEVLLHYHCSPVRHPQHDAPAVIEARERFIADGVLEPAENFPEVCFATTEKGRKLVEMLCYTPLPVARYIDPREATQSSYALSLPEFKLKLYKDFMEASPVIPGESVIKE